MQNTHSSNFDLKQYWAIILKRKYLSLTVCLIVLSAFTWGSFLLPKAYEASSTVFVERSYVIDPLIKGIGVTSSMEERLKILKDRITTRNIIDRVMKKLDMDINIKSPEQYEARINSIRENLDIKVKTSRTRGDETQLFSISYKDKDPVIVRDLVNTLISEYIEENLTYKRTDAYSAYEFIDGQLLEYKKKLDDSDRAIREFREKNPHLIPQSEGTLQTRIENFQSILIDTEIKLKELIKKRENLQKQLSGEKELTVAFVTKEGSPQARLNFLNNTLMVLLTKYTDNYPEVIKVKSEIEELKKQIAEAKDAKSEHIGSETATINPIYQQIREELAKTDSEIESLKARSEEILKQQQAAQNLLGRMPKEQEEWSKLQRDRNVYQKIYDDLLQKLENARVSKDLEFADKTATFKVVDPAILPHYPVSPDRAKMIIMGIFLGIASGIGIAFALEYIHPTLKDEAAIENQFKLPVLATIPQIITEQDRIYRLKKDKRIFTAAAVYLFVIMLVFAREVLSRYAGISIINF